MKCGDGMKDISQWEVTGHGEKSTLEKRELISPDGIPYVLKFPREFSANRTNWEDVNEIIAAKIAELLGLKAVEAEVVYYKHRRGCLMPHFKFQLSADNAVVIAELLESEFGEEYVKIHSSSLPNRERLQAFMDLFKRFSYFPLLKREFVFMNLYDVFIGNQDRHAHNWQLLFRNGEAFPAPLYDNGASLGWQLNEDKIKEYLVSEPMRQKYFRKAKSKAGMDNAETPKINAGSLIGYLSEYFPAECEEFIKKINDFPVDQYHSFIEEFPLISKLRKDFLLLFVKDRSKRLKISLTKGGQI